MNYSSYNFPLTFPIMLVERGLKQMKTKPLLNLNIGKYIKARRLNKGYTQEYLAGEIGIAQEYLSQIETGKRNPTYDLLFNLARALDTVPSQISKEVENEVLPQLNKKSSADNR